MSYFDRMAHALVRMLSYQRRFGWHATWQRLRRELRQPAAAPGLTMPGPSVPGKTATAATVAQWLQARFPDLRPLRTYRLPPHGRRRISVVTDSIAKGSLFGGVGTALIFATQLANRCGADLRIVTRTEPPVPSSLDHVLQVYGLQLRGESQFRFVPADDAAQELDLLEHEIVITTSWWTTVAALPGVGAASLVYLLQEDERMFYPHGDERLRCEQLLQRRDIRFVINTRLLLEHFIAEGFDHFRQQATSFEPAFPERVFHARARPAAAKKRFVFYARPNNARNLFFLGLEVIDAAITRGVLDPLTWEIVFVGKHIPDVVLGAGHRPVKRENLDWADYAELVGAADLGLSLMATPHPSYPPLDMVASGAVVVSNRCGVKQDLSPLSGNLILCNLDRDALVDGLARGVALAADEPTRQKHQREGKLPRDWQHALHDVVERLVRVN